MASVQAFQIGLAGVPRYRSVAKLRLTSHDQNHHAVSYSLLVGPERPLPGGGQVGPCLTDEDHRPLPERRPHVSRYAGARTLQERSLRQIVQVESFYLLC